jgi:hypothetical protein
MKNLYVLITISIVIFYSSLNAQWVKTLSMQPGAISYAFAELGTTFFAGSLGDGVFRSTDNGTSWTAVNNGLDTNVLSLAISGTNLFAGTYDGIFLSTNSGESWTEAGLTGVSVLSLAVSGTNLIAGSSSIFFSTNNGTSWTVAGTGFPGFLQTACYSLVVSGTNSFATFGPTYFIPFRSGLMLSTNNGTSWTVVDTSFTDSLVFSLAVLGTNLFAGGVGVHLSTNNGTTWTVDSTGMGFTPVNSLAVSGTNVFAGTNGGGVFLSTSNGTSWTAVNSGLPGGNSSFTRSLTLVGTYLFVVTDDGLVWRRPLSEMITGIEDQSNEIPTQFILAQNYPNPFNPSTKIRFQVPNSSFVNLKVYDVLGNEVATLVNEERPVGSYEVDFNAAGLSSGIYFYTINAGTFVETKKMILLK